MGRINEEGGHSETATSPLWNLMGAEEEGPRPWQIQGTQYQCVFVLFSICPAKQDKVKCFPLIHSCVMFSRANDLFGCVHTCCKRNQSTGVARSFSHIHTISPACCQSEGNLSLPPFIFVSVTPTSATTSFLTSFLSPHKRTPHRKVSVATRRNLIRQEGEFNRSATSRNTWKHFSPLLLKNSPSDSQLDRKSL